MNARRRPRGWRSQIGRKPARRFASWPVLMMAAAAMIATGCPRHLPIARPYPPPTADELADALLVRQRGVGAMSARARATSWLGGDRVRATVLMLVDRQGRLRFEAEVSLQGTVAILTTDGQRFAFLDAVKNQLRRGPACPANVASLIRIPLSPADIAAILLGDVRLPAAAGAAPIDRSVDWDAERGADVLVARRNDGWLRLVMQRQDGDPRQFRLLGAVATGSEGRARWRVAFEDFEDVTLAPADAPGSPPAPTPGLTPGVGARVALPRTIRFAEGDASFDDGVEIKVKERTVNEAMTDDAFVVTPAAGTAVVDVGCP